ncbi:uncharacterized protein LOC144115296 isoform X2 [Amblyomma americanum]
MCITMMRWPFPGSLLQAMVVLILAQAAHARCSVLPPTLRLLPLHISHPGNIPGAVDGPFSVLMCITMMRWPFPGSLLQAMVVLILAQAAHARCSVLPPTLRLLPLHISHPEWLFLRAHSGASSAHGALEWRRWSQTADRTTEFLWRCALPQLRAITKKTHQESFSPVHTYGEVSLPEQVQGVLRRGPKFAVEPRRSAPELLEM